MRITATTPDGCRDAEVVTPPGTTVGDLAALLRLDDGDVCIDGVEVTRHQPLDGVPLRAGSIIGPPTGGSPTPGSPHPTLVACGGLGSGIRKPLEPGSEIIVGRGSTADVRIANRTISVQHLAVLADEQGVAFAQDMGSRNGTRHDGRWLSSRPSRLLPDRPIDAGSSRLRLETAGQDVRPLGPPGPDGRVLFNRPPRTAPLPLPEAIPTPPAPSRLAGRAPFSWALLFAPILVGLVLAITFTPVLALFALAGPVVTLASWFENRRRERRDDRTQVIRFGRSLRQFEAALMTAKETFEERLRDHNPDPGEVVRRAVGPARSLWERCPPHDDFLVVRVGSGGIPWDPPLGPSPTGDHPPDVEALVASHGLLRDVPVTVDLRHNPCLGIVGPHELTSALARAILCQLVTHQGPADLRVRLPDDRTEWLWAEWLPHVISDAHEAEGCHVVVIDPATAQLTSRPEDSGGTEHIQIVLAREADLLPSWCDTVVELVGSDGVVRVHRPSLAETHERVLADGLDEEVAEGVARSLGRLHDPLEGSIDPLPDRIWLGTLLGLEDPSAALVAQRWASGETAPRALIGVGPEGPLSVDLVTDGPHGLIGGTTGSGKSELLRTLVVSLATTVPPDRLAFLLVDYKGGSTFDACVDLPHTVGVVTDLDAGLGERCLRSLEAEIRRRERVLRDRGQVDLDELLISCDMAGTAAPLARLVVIVDEFAALARELPDFLASLVGIAERGRSLGIHLLLATQRPSGVVSDSIKANANLRIGLRVLDHHESADVLGHAGAATIPPGLPGRALVRVGPGEVTPVQFAITQGGPDRDRQTVPAVRWLDDDLPGAPAPAAPDRYLRSLVDAVRVAAEGRPGPVVPWVPPLPDRIDLGEVAAEYLVSGSIDGAAGGAAVLVGMADDPDNQRRAPWCWQLDAGNLLLYGLPGSGVTTAVHTIVHSLAKHDATARHVYVVSSSPELLGLAEIPFVGAVVDPACPGRISRLIQHLEVIRVPTVVLVDGLGRLLSELDRSGGITAVERWTRLVAEPPAGRCWFALGAERVGAVPAAIGGTARQRLVFRLADPFDYSALGLAPVSPRRMSAGRAIDATTGLEVQVALPGDPPGPRPDLDVIEPPDPIDVLPDRVGLAPLLGGARSTDGVIELPIGLTEGSLRTSVAIAPGEHILVAGRRGAGCSTALETMAKAAVVAEPDLTVVATGTARSGLRARLPPGARWVETDDLPTIITGLAATGERWLLLVDDAHLVDDPERSLAQSIGCHHGGSILVAGWAEGLRSAYNHWTRELRLSRWGLALGAAAADGELWATELPARPGTPPGRGWLLEHGRGREVQVAEP